MITMAELEARISATGEMTASELDRLLHSCPEWVAQEKEREQRLAAERARLDAEQVPLIEDLLAVGYDVESPWDFVNTAESYPEAIPVLLKHIEGPYDWRTRDGIVRALTVVEARGAPARQVLEAFKRSSEDIQHVRWAYANALQVIADASMADEISGLAATETDESVARLLRLAAVKAAKRKVKRTGGIF
jgi:hypothetical protein